MKRAHQYNFDTMMEFVYETTEKNPDPCSDFFYNFSTTFPQESQFSIDTDKDKIEFSDQAGHSKLKYVDKDLTLSQYKTLSDQYMKDNFYKKYQNKSKNSIYLNSQYPK